MSSNINPNNIDTTYPIAGQDNDSQGFRDNFTNIKTNFQYAEDEISDLQQNVILKAALTGTTLDNDMGGAPIYNATLNGARTTRVSLGNASTQTIPGTIPIDYTAGAYHSFTLDYNSSLDFQNWPSAGNGSWVRVIVTVSSTSYTLTLPAAVTLGVTGIQGISANVITFATTGTFAFEFTTSNGGTTITVQDLNRPLNYYTNGLTVVGAIAGGSTISATGTVTGGNLATGGTVSATGSITTAAPLFLHSSEDLANGAAASLTKTVSYFSTDGAETATLAAGTDGQIKVFAMVGFVGNMVITVTNAGWKTSGTGTITFNAVGDACTLIYTNSKWFCIGQNSVTLA